MSAKQPHGDTGLWHDIPGPHGDQALALKSPRALLKLEADPRPVIRERCWGSGLATCLLRRMVCRNPNRPGSQTQRSTENRWVVQMGEVGSERTFCGQQENLGPGSRAATSQIWHQGATRQKWSPVLPDSPDFQETENLFFSCCPIIQHF